MGKPFTSWSYDDAANAVQAKLALPKSGGWRDFPLWSSWLGKVWPQRDVGTLSNNPRRPDTAIRASRFYFDDHWQDDWGFIGQLPPASLPGAHFMKADIKKGFVADNVIKEVVKTHVGGILGREPSWSFLETVGEKNAERTPLEQETGETLTRHWNERKALKDFQKAARILMCEGTVVRRVFFPRAVTVTARELIDALNFIYFETCYADQAGVFTDPDTMRDIGVYLFDQINDKNEVAAKCAELSYLNDAGETVCKVVKDKGDPIEYGPYPLGGHLLIYEMTRDPLITEQVQSNQRALNLAHTQMIRNVNLAGNRETNITNAVPPGPVTDKTTITTATTKTADGRFPGTYKKGVGAVNFLMGVPIRDEDSNVVGYTNPTVNITDPVSVETFERTIAQQRAAIYSQCHQRHVLVVDKADTSGRAREVAQREFERSLNETKTEVDACGRWQLETTLRLAAWITGDSTRYQPLRADFNSRVTAGDPDPEKQKLALLMRTPGGPKNQPLFSDETCRSIAGSEDPAAEKALIDAEAKLPEAKLPEGMLPVEGQQTPKPASNSIN